jgi:ABC-type uncharacterized transport system substrate-binding protein
MRRTFWLLIVSIYTLVPASAHPHMLLLPRLDFDFDGTTCSGFWVEWGFDSYFTASIIQNYDVNRDGTFDEGETRAIHDGAFINLENYGYFVYLRRGDNRTHPNEVEHFTVWLKDNRLYYKFYVSLAGRGFKDDFSVAIFDPTYFCSVKYQNPALTITQAQGPRPHYKIAANSKYPVYYDPMSPASDLTTYEKWQPGLQTAYPEEIRLYFP